ncbi:MAG: hypothetical protein C4K49_00845 [Candidatus Thorarchaeota archaeon]|nr:MAG: hypothetical protein C4K49_00845 [Candidatus Thorarchaeota archaeon]
MFDLSKGFLTELKEGIRKLMSSAATSRMPRADLTRICQEEGHLSIHGVKLDLSAGDACPKSLLDSLTSEERKQADGLEKSWRMRQYCTGRVLAKRSVVDVCAHIGVRVKTQVVSIVDDERGAPVCKVESERELPAISVSLTHKGDVLLAVASIAERVGIDLEDLSESHRGTAQWTSVDRNGKLKDAAKSRVEQLCGYTDPGRIATVMWCVREAAYKALSRGRPLSPIQIVLQSAEGHLVARAGPDSPLQANVVIGCMDQYVCVLAL